MKQPDTHLSARHGAFARFGALMTCAAALMCATPQIALAGGATQTWTQGPRRALTSSSFIPKLDSDEAYIERYTISIDLDGGGWIGADMTISNLGWGDNHGASRVRIHLPGQKKFNYSKKVDKDEWSSSSKTLDLKIAGARLKARGKNGFTVSFRGDGASMDLDVTNILPRWQPGNGRIDVEDGYFTYALLAPRAKMTGKVTVDGKTYEVKSTDRAFADHTATNVAPYNFARRFGRFRHFEGDVSIAWREVELHEDFGGRSLTWMMVGYKDKIVFSDASISAKLGKLKKDKAGYNVPHAVQIDAKSGKDSVRLIHRATKMKREDLLESYGTAVKAVASAVSTPYRYTLPGTFEMQMTIQGATAEVSGKGTYSFDFLNPK